MTKTLFTPKGKQLQGLTRRFWRQFDNANSGAEIFAGVRKLMTELRFGKYMQERETPLTDEEALVDLKDKLVAFTAAYGEVDDDELRRLYHAISWGDRLTCNVFAWFATSGLQGRTFFEEQDYKPDCFVKQADIDLASKLASLKEWDEVKLVYENHEFDTD
jgi:hypothetical protein